MQKPILFIAWANDICEGKGGMNDRSKKRGFWIQGISECVLIQVKSGVGLPCEAAGLVDPDIACNLYAWLDETLQVTSSKKRYYGEWLEKFHKP